MAWVASLSANAPTESSGYRVPSRPDISQVSESGNANQPMNLGQQVGGQQIGGQQLGGP